MPTSQSIATMGFILGPVLILIAGLAWWGKLPMSGLVGIRTRHTMASREAWVAGHRFAAPYFLAFGAVLVCSAGLCVSPGAVQSWVDSDGVGGYVQAAYMILTLVGLIAVAWQADQAASR